MTAGKDSIYKQVWDEHQLDALLSCRVENARLRAALRDVLLGGTHDGPCPDPDYGPDDACERHLATADARREAARAVLGEARPSRPAPHSRRSANANPKSSR